jgi:hypothetical protein
MIISKWFYEVLYYINYITPVHKEISIPIDNENITLTNERIIMIIQREKHQKLSEDLIKIQSSRKILITKDASKFKISD